MRIKILLLSVAASLGPCIVSNSAVGQTWSLTSAPTNSWISVAASADGSKLVAASGGRYATAGNGLIYTSVDFGLTWRATSAPSTNWSSVACSAGGNKLVASSPGGVYTSVDSGITWTMTGVKGFTSISLSADGNKLAGIAGFGGISTSTNSGGAWTTTSAPAAQWWSLASSANGTKLVGAENECGILIRGGIVSSTDSGATWNLSTEPPGLQCSVFAACSADGSRLAAGGGDSVGPIWTSTDSGSNWMQTSAPVEPWVSAAFSADGTKLVAVSSGPYGGPEGGPVYTSADSGATWISNNAPVTYWTSVACSADGCALVAVVYGGGIYTSRIASTPVLTLTPSSSDFLLSWTIPSISFTLQENSELITSNWIDVTTPPVLNLTTLQNQVSVKTPANGKRFYRLKH